MSSDQTRRSVLRRLALVGGAAALAGCGERSDRSERTPIGPRLGTPRSNRSIPEAVRRQAEQWGFDAAVTVDVKGSDRTVDRALRETIEEGVLAYLPPGTYRLTEPFERTDFERVGLLGRGATIVPPEGYDDTLIRLGAPGDASAVIVEGLSFDFRAPETGGRPVVLGADDELVLRDVSVTGRQDVPSDMVRVDVGADDGRALVERLRLPDGGFTDRWEDDSGVTGCEVGSPSSGELSFVDCHIEGFPDNGLYADPEEGVVRVEGGYFANNGVANVRVNGGPGSVVRNVHVRCDETRAGVENMRGIRLRGGDAPLVENCLVELDAVTSSDGAVTVHSRLAAATIRNCRIRVDADGVPAIRVKTPHSSVDGAGPVTVSNVTVEGTASEAAVVDVSERENVTLDGLCLTQTGRRRDGIRMQKTQGRLNAALIAVRGRPMVFEESAVETSDVTVDRHPERLSTEQRSHCQRLGSR